MENWKLEDSTTYWPLTKTAQEVIRKAKGL